MSLVITLENLFIPPVYGPPPHTTMGAVFGFTFHPGADNIGCGCVNPRLCTNVNAYELLFGPHGT